VRSGLITLEQVRAGAAVRRALRASAAGAPAAAGRRLLYEAIRRMLSALVYDVIDATARRSAPRAGQRGRGARLGRRWCLQRGMRAQSRELKPSCSTTCTAIRA
jgi:dGTPase